MDSLLPWIAKIVLVGGIGVWFLGRRVWTVIRKRKLWRERAKAGRPVRLSAEERRKYKLEMTVAIGVLGIPAFGILFVLAAALGASAWVGVTLLALAGVSGFMAATVEGLFL